MRCSQFAKDFAAHTDSGTSDYLQVSVPDEPGSRSSRRRAPLNPKVGPQAACMCRLSIRAVHTSTPGAVWVQILRGLEFPCDGRQTDRQTDSQTDRRTDRQTEIETQLLQTEKELVSTYEAHDMEVLEIKWAYVGCQTWQLC